MGLPDQLDSDWSGWMIGEWIGTGEGAVGKGQHLMTVELGLGGQFLLTKYISKLSEMSDENISYMKDKMHFSEADIERIHHTKFEELGIATMLPGSDEIVVHIFDSWRTILTGKGTWDGHKETIRFTGENASGVRVIERVNHNHMFITQEWNMQDGSVMVETGELKRVGNNKK